MNKSILIIGRISSGKSTIAKEIQNSISNCRIISFGSYLKDYSEKRNWKIDRLSLQDLGQRFIDENPANFLSNVVHHNKAKDGEILIFEGVRHQPILNAIGMYYPVLLSIYLNVDVDTRYDRYLTRNKSIDKRSSKEDFLKADNHKVELEIESLKNDCDLVIGLEGIIDSVRKIKEMIKL